MQHQEENKAILDKLWHLSEDYKHDFQPDVDKGLANLKARIARTEALPTEAKVVSIGRRQWLGRIAASVVFLLTCGFLFNLFIKDAHSLQQIATTDNMLENVLLPDGSAVWVNKHSQLSFPKTFNGTARIVQLKGEAFFKVVKNVNQPFIVQTEDSQIKVLGTAFNVRAYQQEMTTAVEVEEGSVSFMAEKTKEQKTLAANDKIVFNKMDATLSPVKALNWNDTAWKNKLLDFENQPLATVLTYLETNFEVEVDFDEENLGNCPLNAFLVKNKPEAILKQVDLAFESVKLKKVHSKYYQLSGTSCD